MKVPRNNEEGTKDRVEALCGLTALLVTRVPFTAAQPSKMHGCMKNRALPHIIFYCFPVSTTYRDWALPFSYLLCITAASARPSYVMRTVGEMAQICFVFPWLYLCWCKANGVTSCLWFRDRRGVKQAYSGSWQALSLSVLCCKCLF